MYLPGWGPGQVDRTRIRTQNHWSVGRGIRHICKVTKTMSSNSKVDGKTFFTQLIACQCTFFLSTNFSFWSGGYNFQLSVILFSLYKTIQKCQIKFYGSHSFMRAKVVLYSKVWIKWLRAISNSTKVTSFDELSFLMKINIFLHTQDLCSRTTVFSSINQFHRQTLKKISCDNILTVKFF